MENNFKTQGGLIISSAGAGNNTHSLLVRDSTGLVKTITNNFYIQSEIQDFFDGTTGIAGYNKSNWDTAYGWGDHSGLYSLLGHTHNYEDPLTFASTGAASVSRAGNTITIGATNTTYSNMSLGELTTGTSTTARSISASTLKSWGDGRYLTAMPAHDHDADYLAIDGQDNEVTVININEADLPADYTKADVVAHLNTLGVSKDDVETIVVNIDDTTQFTIDWGSVTGKPSTYPAAPHNHDSDYLQLSGGTVTGPTTFDSEVTLKGQADSGSGTYGMTPDVSLALEHASGGSSSIYFKSGVNWPSDFGYIRFEDSHTGSGESARMTIGVENDGATDHIMLKSKVIINADLFSSDPTDIVEFQSGSSYRGKIDNGGNLSLNGTITASGGNSTNWNTAYGWGNHATAGYASNSHNHDSDYLQLTGGTLDNGTSTTLNIVCDDAGEAVLNLMGGSQGTGKLYVGQSTTHGGGIEYNGDGTPTSSGSGSDYITLYRRSASVDTWTARNLHSSNDWEFRGQVIAAGGNSTNWNTAYGWGNHASAGYLTSETDTFDSVTTRGNTTTNDITVGYTNVNGGVNFLNGATDFRIYNNPGNNELFLRDTTNATMLMSFGVGYATANVPFFADNGVTVTGAVTATSIVKSGASSSDILLGNGTTVSTLSFASSGHTHTNYLDKSGGTMTGDITLGTGADLLVDANRYAFRYSADQNYGMYFNSTDSRVDIKGASGTVRWYSDVANGNMWAGGVITASGGNSTNWNTAFGWGNHASAGYLTSIPNFQQVLDAGSNEVTTGVKVPYVQAGNGDGLELYGDDNDGTSRGANISIGGNVAPYVNMTIGDVTNNAGQFNVTNRYTTTLGSVLFDHMDNVRFNVDGVDNVFHEFDSSYYTFSNSDTLASRTQIGLGEVLMHGGSGGNHHFYLKQLGSMASLIQTDTALEIRTNGGAGPLTTIGTDGSLTLSSGKVPVSEGTGANEVSGFWQGTQAEYDAIPTKNPNTIYFIK